MKRFVVAGLGFLALAAGIVVAVGLTLFAFDQRSGADRERRIAETRELSSASIANLDVDPERSMFMSPPVLENGSKPHAVRI